MSRQKSYTVKVDTICFASHSWVYVKAEIRAKFHRHFLPTVSYPVSEYKFSLVQFLQPLTPYGCGCNLTAPSTRKGTRISKRSTTKLKNCTEKGKILNARTPVTEKISHVTYGLQPSFGDLVVPKPVV